MRAFLFIIFIVAASADNHPAAGVACLVSLIVLYVRSREEEYQEGRTIIMGHKTCPYCGANLDAGERCDCRDENVESQRDSKIDSIGQTESDTH